MTGDVITAVGTGDLDPSAAGLEITDLGDVTLAPGYDDIHCHGGGGAAFGSPGQAGIDDAHTILKTHLATGTTTMVGSLVTGAIA